MPRGGIPADLLHQRFERLVVHSRAGSYPSGGARWECICDCGQITYVRTRELRSGRTRSCGCWARDWNAARGKINSQFRERYLTHGASQHPAYGSYRSMIRRCYVESDGKYPDYGGRGVTVCDRWLESPWNFIHDLGDRAPGLTLDRINVDGNYEPGNCRWADRLTQTRNRRPLTSNRQLRAMQAELDLWRQRALILGFEETS